VGLHVALILLARWLTLH